MGPRGDKQQNWGPVKKPLQFWTQRRRAYSEPRLCVTSDGTNLIGGVEKGQSAPYFARKMKRNGIHAGIQFKAERSERGSDSSTEYKLGAKSARS